MTQTMLVRDIRAASQIVNTGVPAVVSLVDRPSAVPFTHERHLVRCFRDTASSWIPFGPRTKDVEAIVEFARSTGPCNRFLVHCRLGQSRSPAAALVVAVTWGDNPEHAVTTLAANHPPDRVFWPNPLIIRLGDRVLDLGGQLVDAVEVWKRAQFRRSTDR